MGMPELLIVLLLVTPGLVVLGAAKLVARLRRS